MAGKASRAPSKGPKRGSRPGAKNRKGPKRRPRKPSPAPRVRANTRKTAKAKPKPKPKAAPRSGEFTPAQMAKALQVKPAIVRQHVEDGAPVNDAGRLHIVEYVAWLNHEQRGRHAR